MTGGEASSFSTMIMVNNIRVSFFCFVLGFVWGVGTIVLLFYNGVILGALAANFFRWQMSLDFWALILPHGIIEISSIIIASAAGLIIGWSLIFPNERSRKEALLENGRDALMLLMGTIPLLILAGLTEGFITPLDFIGPIGKLSFALVTIVFIVFYLFYFNSTRNSGTSK
jgi:uncharacterized membrane protein SpoIIM required for sporulation